MSFLIKAYPGDRAVMVATVVFVTLTLIALAALTVSRGLERKPAAAHAVLLWALLWILATPIVATAFIGVGKPLFSIRLPMSASQAALETPSQPLPDDTFPTPVSAQFVSIIPSGETRDRTVINGSAGSATVSREVKLEPQVPRVPAGRDLAQASSHDATRPVAAVASGVTPGSGSLRPFATFLIGLWCFGIALFAASIVRSYARLRTIRAGLTPLLDQALIVVADEVQRNLGLVKGPRIASSATVAAPCVIGLFQPVVILPAACLRTVDPDRLRDVLLHECAHVLRRDCLVVLLQRLAAALFWLNPLIHLLNRRLASVREEVCDNYVLARSDRARYAEALLQFAQLARGGRPIPASVGVLQRRGQLEQRIAGLIDESRNRRTTIGRGYSAVVAGMLGALCVIACGSSLVSGEPAPSSTSTAQPMPPAKQESATPNGKTTSRRTTTTTTTTEEKKPSETNGTIRALYAVKDRPNTVHIPIRRVVMPDGTTKELIATVEKAPATHPVQMLATLSLDPTHLFRLRAQFIQPSSTVEIVEVAKVSDGGGGTREIRPGDRVRRGDLLAVCNSSDVASKKSELIGTLQQQKLDNEILKRAQLKSEQIPEVFLLNARRNLQTDINQVNRIVTTLRSWGLSEQDVQAVRDEAAKVGTNGRIGDAAREAQWGRVELRTPVDGTVVERNVAVHEVIGDSQTVLFQIANLDELQLNASCSLGELPDIEALPETMRRFTIPVRGGSVTGEIDSIGYSVDPSTGTVAIKGHVDNKSGKLRAGQFVQTTIQIPNPPGLVAIPSSAIGTDQGRNFVYVETDATNHEFTKHWVNVRSANANLALIESAPATRSEKESRQAEGQGPKFDRLRPGERIYKIASDALPDRRKVDQMEKR